MIRRSDGTAPDLIVTNTEQPVVISHEDLPPETLHRLIESFVNREGTDYGPRQWTLLLTVFAALALLMAAGKRP